MTRVLDRSTLTCPRCCHAETETMPSDACLVFYDCKGCGAALRALPGDCCVFCSFGSIPCPPIQRERAADRPKSTRVGVCRRGETDSR